jgi:hypothetical protein
MLEPFVVPFPLIPLPNPWAKGLDFGVFVVLGLVVFLAEILQFLLIQWVLVDHNLAMECPWGVPTIPKVLCGSVERSGDQELDLGELTRGCCSSRAAQTWPVWPVLLTGLTGVSLLWNLARWFAWSVCLWVVLLLVSSWLVWCCFARLCVGFFFLAGCVLGAFLF